MTKPLTILGISGSLRKDSYNTAMLRVAQELAPSSVVIELSDLSQIPLYNQDVRNERIPRAVERLTGQVAAADALLFATPEYNYSISGVIKNAIDWLSRESPQPFAGKPAAVMSASMGLFGGVRAQYDLRRILVYLDVHFINKPEVMIASAHERFDAAGTLVHEPSRQFVEQLVASLVGWTERLQAR